MFVVLGSVILGSGVLTSAGLDGCVLGVDVFISGTLTWDVLSVITTLGGADCVLSFGGS